MKEITTLLCALLITGCSKNESLVFVMEVSLAEQFTNACNTNLKYVSGVESFMEGCFNKKLAIDAINGKAEEKNKINIKHILEIESCLSEKNRG